MNTNDITLDHFPTCCARLIKDNASNVVNQGLCPNKAKVLQQGNLRGSLFNKGNGDTVVGLCKTHANVSNRKPINVHLSNTTINNTENNMTTEQLHWAFEDDCDENNEGYLIFEGTCDMCDATGQMRYGYSARNDGVKVPVITHCADGCTRDFTMVEDNDAFVQQIHDLAETKAQLQSLTDPRPIYEDDIPVIYINTTKENTMTKQELDFTPMGHPDWDDPNANPVTEGEARFYDQEPMWEGEPVSMYAEEIRQDCGCLVRFEGEDGYRGYGGKQIEICSTHSQPEYSDPQSERPTSTKPKGYISCGNCRKNGSPTPWHRNINEAKICYAHRS